MLGHHLIRLCGTKLILAPRSIVIATAAAVAPISSMAEKAANIYGFEHKDIDGNDVSLSKYKGKVTLIVNVASA